MCKINEDMCNEVAKEAKKENSIRIATALINDDEMKIEKIAKITGLALEEVKELADQIKSTV